MSCSSCSCRRLCSSSSSSSLPLDLRLMSAPASTKPQHRESFVHQFNCSSKISMLAHRTGQFDLLNKQSSISSQSQKTFSKFLLNKTHLDSLPYGYQACYKLNKILNYTQAPNQAMVLDTKVMIDPNVERSSRCWFWKHGFNNSSNWSQLKTKSLIYIYSFIETQRSKSELPFQMEN